MNKLINELVEIMELGNQHKLHDFYTKIESISDNELKTIQQTAAIIFEELREEQTKQERLMAERNLKIKKYNILLGALYQELRGEN